MSTPMLLEPTTSLSHLICLLYISDGRFFIKVLPLSFCRALKGKPFDLIVFVSLPLLTSDYVSLSEFGVDNFASVETYAIIFWRSYV